jgi:DNA-binding transcriptional LysR family regulator
MILMHSLSARADPRCPCAGTFPRGAESLVAAARLGLGLIQVPRYHIEDDLKRGTLLAVLPDCPPSPTPVSLLYPRNRQLSPRVRVFIDWLMRAFGAARGTGHDRDHTGFAHTL